MFGAFCRKEGRKENPPGCNKFLYYNLFERVIFLNANKTYKNSTMRHFFYYHSNNECTFIRTMHVHTSIDRILPSNLFSFTQQQSNQTTIWMQNDCKNVHAWKWLFPMLSLKTWILQRDKVQRWWDVVRYVQNAMCFQQISIRRLNEARGLSMMFHVSNTRVRLLQWLFNETFSRELT